MISKRIAVLTLWRDSDEAIDQALAQYEWLEKETTLKGNRFIYAFLENDNAVIKNIVKVDYDEVDPPFEKTTFISKIGIYDEMKNLIGIAKVSKPVKKTEGRDLTFKVKLDL